MATVARDANLLEDPQWLGEQIFDVIPADGVGVFRDGAISLTGLTPPPEQFVAIVQMLNSKNVKDVFTCESLQTLLPEAASYADKAAGMLSIPLSRAQGDYAVLFRAEQMRAVRWAGNPEKPVEYGPHGARLTPRKSFEAWSELVKGQALPFTAAERRVAEGLRSGMLEVLVRLSDSAEAERAKAHERQALLIAELNHRVRNILPLIRGLISQSRASAETVEGFVATLDDRIRALARAHDQITSQQWGPARLSDLLEVEAGAFLGQKRAQITLEGPPLLVQPVAFTALALVFHELMTNAAKYGALSDSGAVAVTWSLGDSGDLVIDWAETGGPAVTAPSRRGFGSTIIEQSIPFDLGGKATISYHVTGVTAQFSVPARHVVGAAAAGVTARKASGPVLAEPLKGKHALLVEDSMIIAMEAEDSLKQVGAARVTLAANLARAKFALEKGGIDFVLLDFNLGSENSLPLAEMLTQHGIPFAFATGYGEGAGLGERFPGVTVLTKPYDAVHLRRALTSLFA